MGGPLFVVWGVAEVGWIELGMRVGKFDELDGGVLGVDGVKQVAIFWSAIEEVIANGDDDFFGEVARLLDTFAQKAGVVCTKRDYSVDSHKVLNYIERYDYFRQQSVYFRLRPVRLVWKRNLLGTIFPLSHLLGCYNL